MAKKSPEKKSILNKRARFDYDLGESYVVGLELTGAETKSLRMGHADLRGAYVNIVNDELWLLNAQINGYKGVNIPEDQITRTRKLLAKRSEIEKLQAAKQASNTIIPIQFLTEGRYIKLKIAPGRGKKKYDKRETIKKRDLEREAKGSL